MNSLILIGRLGKDVVVKHGANNMAVASGSLAVAGYKKDQTEWIYFSAFSKTAEFLEKYGKKGTSLAIEGHLHVDEYEKDGQKVSRLGVIADRVEFAGSKSESSSNSGAGTTTTESGISGFAPIEEDELPFQ